MATRILITGGAGFVGSNLALALKCRSHDVVIAELTELCRERTSRPIPIGSNPTTSPADVPYYVTDTSHVTRETGWSPRHGMTELLDDVFQWLQEHRETLEPLMAGNVSADVPALHARTAS